MSIPTPLSSPAAPFFSITATPLLTQEIVSAGGTKRTRIDEPAKPFMDKSFLPVHVFSIAACQNLILAGLTLKEWYINRRINRSFNTVNFSIIFKDAYKGCMDLNKMPIPIEQQRSVVYQVADTIFSLSLRNPVEISNITLIPLKNLTRLDISFTYDKRDFEDALKGFTKCLSSYPKLRSLKIDFYDVGSIQTVISLLRSCTNVTNLELLTQDLNQQKEDPLEWAQAVNSLPKLRELNLTINVDLEGKNRCFWEHLPADCLFFDKLSSLSFNNQSGDQSNFGDECFGLLNRCKSLTAFNLIGGEYDFDGGFSDKIGDVLSRHSQLRSMELVFSVHKDLNILFKLPEGLQEIKLYNNDPSADEENPIDFSNLTRFKSLTRLSLSNLGRYINDRLLMEIAHVSSLRHLLCFDKMHRKRRRIQGTAVANAGIACLASMPRLESLVITEGRFTESGLGILGRNSISLREITIIKGSTRFSTINIERLRKDHPRILFIKED